MASYYIKHEENKVYKVLVFLKEEFVKWIEVFEDDGMTAWREYGESFEEQIHKRFPNVFANFPFELLYLIQQFDEIESESDYDQIEVLEMLKELSFIESRELGNMFWSTKK